jgi:hypothetical protein
MKNCVAAAFLLALASATAASLGQVRVVELQFDDSTQCYSSTAWINVISRDRSTAGGVMWLYGHGTATTAYVWDLTTGLASSGNCHAGVVTSLSADGRLVGLSQRPEFVLGGALWDRTTGVVQYTDDYGSIAISGNGQRLLESDEFLGQTRIRDRVSGANIATVPGIDGIANEAGDIVWTTTHVWYEGMGATPLPQVEFSEIGPSYFLRTMSGDGRVFGGGNFSPTPTSGYVSVDGQVTLTVGQNLISSSDRGLVRITSSRWGQYSDSFITSPRHGTLPSREFFAREAPTFMPTAVKVVPQSVSADGLGMVVYVERLWQDGGAGTFYLEFTGGYLCDSIDFNNNGVFPEDQDLADFFNVLAGAGCETCNDIDFNNDGVFPSEDDAFDFFNVLAGGAC